MRKSILAALALCFFAISSLTAQRQLTVIGETVNPVKVYDGTTAVDFTAGVLDGVQPGDTVQLTTTAVYAGIQPADSVAIIVSYTLTGPQAGNYLAPASRLIKGVISPKPIYATSQVTTYKIYDGNAVAGSALLSYSGVVGSEDVTVTPSATYDSKNRGVYKTITLHYSLSGADASHYLAPADSLITNGAIDPVVTSLTTQTLLRFTKVYDGTDSVKVLSTGGVSGILPGDDAYLVASATYSSAEVGDNLDVVLAYSFGGVDGVNYVAPATQLFSHIGIITQKRLTLLTPTTVQPSKVYDRTTSCLVTSNGEPDGVAEGDDIVLIASAAYFDRLVGEDKNVRVTYQIFGADSANYLAPNSTVTTADITPMQLDIHSSSVQSSKVYDATCTATILSLGSLLNVYVGDSVNCTATALYDNKNVGANKNVYITYTIGGPAAANYLAPLADTVPFNQITPLPLSATGTSIRTTKVYNASPEVSVFSAGEIPVLSGDLVTLSATACYDDKSVGTGKHISITYSLTGPDSANYVVLTADTAGDITPKNIYIQQHATVTDSKVYDGNTSCNISENGTFSGVIGEDELILLSTAEYLTPSAGQDKVVRIRYFLSGADSANYQLYSDTVLTSASITPRSLTVSNENVVTAKAYDGTTNARVIYDGDLDAVSSDSLILRTTATYDSPESGQYKTITLTYHIFGPDAANYVTPASKTIPGEIFDKVDLHLTGTTVSDKTYDGTTDATVASVGTITKISPSHDVTVNATAHFYSANAGISVPVTVTFTLSGEDTAYYITPAPVTLNARIIKRRISVEGSSVTPTRDYDATTNCNVTSVGILLDVIEGDTVTLNATAAYDNKNAGIDKLVTVSYSLAGAQAGNYVTPADTQMTASITRIETYILNTQVTLTKEYDANTIAATIANGTAVVLGSDVVTVLGANAFYDSPALGQNKSIYVAYALGGVDARNYYLAEDTVLFSTVGEITRRAITIENISVTQTKIYDATTSIIVTNSGNLSNKLLYGDSVTFTITSAAYIDKNVGLGKDVILTGVISGPDAANYLLLPLDTLQADITPKTVTVTGTLINNKYYDGTTVAKVANVGQVQNAYTGDDLTLSASASFSTLHATNNATVTVHYTLTGDDAPNYTVEDLTLSQAYIIYPARLRVKTNTLSVQRQKIYDTTDTVHIISYDTTLTNDDGVIGSDVVTISAAAHYDNANAGTGKQINVSFTLGGANWGDYESPSDIVYKDGVISCKELTIDYSSTEVVTEKDYDGTMTAEVSNPGTVTGFYPCDSNKVQLQVHALYDTPEPGNSKTITVYYTLVGSMAGNYCVEPTHIYTYKGIIHSPAGVDDVSGQFDVTLAPNPVNVGQSTYITADVDGIATVELLNAAGQRIMFDQSATFPMALSAPATSGIYFVRIITSDAQVHIRKLIVK